jgi:hypothetical protein
MINTLKNKWQPVKMHYPLVLLALLLLLWWSAPFWMYRLDPTAALADPGLWSLLLLGIIAFLLLLGICRLVLESFWDLLGLPPVEEMVLQFKELELWQQLAFYWASFALLLLAATVCLAAIC